MKNTTTLTIDEWTIQSTWTFVTPELAERWLEKNHGRNRNCSKEVVYKYTHDMKGGQWITTHQGIGFTNDDVLVDGQHRLRSIVASKVGQWILVTTGLPIEAIQAMDRGMNRKLSHILKIMGYETDTAKMAAVAKAMYIGPSHTGVRNATDNTLKDFIDDHIQAVSFAVGLPRDAGNATVVSVFGRAWYHTTEEEIVRFIRAMRDQIPLEDAKEQDKTARTLHRFLTTSRENTGGSVGRMTTYRKTQYALRQYLDGKALDRLYEMERDLFPLPEQKRELPNDDNKTI